MFRADNSSHAISNINRQIKDEINEAQLNFPIEPRKGMGRETI